MSAPGVAASATDRAPAPASALAVRGTIPAPGGGTARVEGLAFNPSTDELFIANQSENRVYVGRATL